MRWELRIAVVIRELCWAVVTFLVGVAVATLLLVLGETVMLEAEREKAPVPGLNEAPPA